MKITATTKEQFEQIEAAYQELPKAIQDKLDAGKKSFGDGFTFDFIQQFNEVVKLTVPSVKYVEHSPEKIRILSEDHNWFEYNYPTTSFETSILKISKEDYK